MGLQKGHRSLRSEIERHLKERGYTLSKLGELTGINPGHVSEILNSNPPRAITISQLDAMGAAFEQAPGWLYELYEEECFSEGKVSRPRVDCQRIISWMRCCNWPMYATRYGDGKMLKNMLMS